jgi:hypothetical protein
VVLMALMVVSGMSWISLRIGCVFRRCFLMMQQVRKECQDQPLAKARRD